MAADPTERGGPVAERRRSLLAGLMIGIAVMAAVDEIVFHQLLNWHHFYDRSTREVALLADGLLHAAELILLVGGFVLFADLRRRGVAVVGSVWAGVFLGAGSFQVWDGLGDHKLLRTHQIRYDVDLLPYDIAWNVAGAILLILGAVMAWRYRASRSTSRT